MTSRTQISILLVLVLFSSIFFPAANILILAFIVSGINQRILIRKNVEFATLAFISFLQIFSFLGLIGLVLDFVLPYTPQFMILSAIVALINVVCITKYSKVLPKDINISKKSLVALVAVTMAAIFLAIPASQTHGPSELIRLLSSGEDNASHFAMIKRSYDSQSPPYFDESDTGLIRTLNIYPQGIHYGFSYMIWSVHPSSNIGVYKLLAAYYSLMVLVVMAFVYISSILVMIYSKGLVKYAAPILLSMIMFFSGGLFLVGWGFFSQIAAYAYLLTILYIVLSIKKISIPLLCSLALLLAGVAFSWYLLLFIAFSTLLPIVFDIFKRRDRVQMIFLPILTGFVMLPVIINSLRSGVGSGALNEPGGVYVFGALAYTTIIIGLLAYLFLYLRKNSAISPYLNIFVLTTVLLTLLIGLYQLSTNGTLEYYYFKSLYLNLFISIAVVGVIVSNLLLSKIKLTEKDAFIIIVLAIIVVPLSLYVFKPTYPRVFKNNWFNHTLLPSTMNDAVALYKQQTPPRDVIYFIPCNTTREYIANRWAGAIFLSETHRRSEYVVSSLTNGSTDESLKRYLRDAPNTVIITKTCPN